MTQTYESLRLQIELKEKVIEEIDKDGKKHYIKKNDEPTEQIITYEPNRKYNNRLQIKIRARRNKICRICSEADIENRDLKTFLEKRNKIEEQLFEHYIMLITGNGDFYRYKDAEKIIMESEYSKKEKEKMCDVLKAVGSHKGISNYLNNIKNEKKDENKTNDNVKSVSRRAYALSILKNIQRCGINPLTIPTRTDIQLEKLDNLVTVYKNANLKESNVLKESKTLEQSTASTQIKISKPKTPKPKVSKQSENLNSSHSFLDGTCEVIYFE